jgi:hypothetical protein
MPSRFDNFPKFELDMMWEALYSAREKAIKEHGAQYNYEANDLTYLIDEIYRAAHWRDRPARPEVSNV